MLSVYNDTGRIFQALCAEASGYVSKQTAFTKIKDPLTDREDQVLKAIEEGLTNKAIAERLSISIETVKSHVKKIYQKLEVNNRMDIVKGKYS